MRQAQFVVLLFTPNDTRDHAVTKELKKSPSALSSYIGTREVLRTRERCGEARAEWFSVLLRTSRTSFRLRPHYTTCPLGQIVTVLYTFVGFSLTMLTLKTMGKMVSKLVMTYEHRFMTSFTQSRQSCLAGHDLETLRRKVFL